MFLNVTAPRCSPINPLWRFLKVRIFSNTASTGGLVAYGSSAQVVLIA